MSPASAPKPTLITSARKRRSLDNDERRTRYLWTMALRVVCFLSATLTPLPWNLILLVAAAVLPTIAVMLANAIDLRREPEPEVPETIERVALPSAEIVDGTVVEEPR
ncbi:MAG TPA: DUF3099 domain-containing protein [Propionicimonas sp.]|uniref:DUF3099 domain-containing protein n=1 Tax=Propionicimonas sp. TaxID=1955623 RepID=UPI002F3FBEA1